MSDRKLSVLLLWIIPLIFTMFGPFSIIDIANWITAGQYFLDHHRLMRSDVFSVLPTSLMIYPAWGISVLYALIYRVTDLIGVCIFHRLLLCLLLWIIYSHSILKLPNPVGKAARYSTYVFWLGASAAFGERPAMVALIFLTLSYIEVAKIKRLADVSSRLIANLCLLNLLWVNIHGSFILLWLMLAWKCAFIFRRSDSRRSVLRTLGALLLIALSSLVNPFTWRVFPYLLETAKKSRGRFFSEWEATSPMAHFPVGLLYAFLFIAFIFYLYRCGKESRFRQALSSPFSLLLLTGLTAIRNATLPFVLLLPALSEAGLLSLDPNPQEELSPRKKFQNILTFSAFLTVLIFLSPPFKKNIYDNTAVYEITDAIQKTGKTCPIFNDEEVGSFLMLRLPNQIFVDSRNIIYSDQVFKNFILASQAAPGWQDYLEKYHACFAVLDTVFDAPLVVALRVEPKWKYVMQEKGVVLFQKLN